MTKFSICLSLTKRLFTTTSTDVTVIGDEVRLSKLIALCGMYSRREAEKLIKEKRVSVNGNVVTTVTDKFNPTKVVVTVDGFALKRINNTDDSAAAPFMLPQLWAVNKIKGELVATTDPNKNRPLLFQRFGSLLNSKNLDLKRVVPVYRLDYNTEGLILLTNSGKLARLMDSPQMNLPRYYRVRVHGLLNDSKLKGLKKGMEIDGIKYGPLNIEIQNRSNTNTWLNITTYDNTNKAIIKPLEKMFLQVRRIICVGFGSYFLDDVLPQGKTFALLRLDSSIHSRFFNRNIAVSPPKVVSKSKSKTV
eukprot:gene7415-10107_t